MRTCSKYWSLQPYISTPPTVYQKSFLFKHVNTELMLIQRCKTYQSAENRMVQYSALMTHLYHSLQGPGNIMEGKTARFVEQDIFWVWHGHRIPELTEDVDTCTSWTPQQFIMEQKVSMKPHHSPRHCWQLMVAWARGVTFVRAVAAAKLPMLQETAFSPHSCKHS